MFKSARKLQRLNRSLLDPVKRTFWLPLIVVGAATVLATTVAKSVIPAIERNKNRAKSDDGRKSNVKKSSAEEDSVDGEASNFEPKIKRKTPLPSYSIGIDVGSSFSKAALNNNMCDDDTAPFLVESKDGRRMISTAMFLSPSQEYLLGQFAKAKRFSHGDSTIYGLHHKLLDINDIDASTPSTFEHFLNNCRGVLPFDTMVLSKSALLYDANIIPALLYATMSLDMIGNVHSKLDGSSGITTKYNVAVPNSLKEACKSDILQLHQSFDKSVTGNLFNSNISLIPDAFCAVVGAMALNILEVNLELPHEYVYVLDVGGRLTQLSLIRCNNHASGSEAPLDMIATKAIEGIGTEYMDDLLVYEIARDFQDTHSIDILADPMAKQRLHDAVEAMRVELCTTFSASISLPFITADATGPKHLEVVYTRQQFEAVICDMVRDLEQQVLSFDSKNRESMGVPKVLCVGGGTRIPQVSKALTSDAVLSHLHADKGGIILPQAPEEIITLGAAAYEKMIN